MNKLTDFYNYIKAFFVTEAKQESYKPWTKEDEQVLKTYHNDGLTDEEISIVLNRSAGAIYQKRLRMQKKGEL